MNILFFILECILIVCAVIFMLLDPTEGPANNVVLAIVLIAAVCHMAVNKFLICSKTE